MGDVPAADHHAAEQQEFGQRLAQERVAVSVAAPETAKTPLTRAALTWDLAVSACGLGSSLAISTGGVCCVCCVFTCCDCRWGSAGGDGGSANAGGGLRANALPRSS